MNLVVNAKDAMAGERTLTLVTENVQVDPGDSVPDPEMAPGPYVSLSMRDTGAGMSAEVMSHLFEPFFTTKEQGRGTGLGLATVYGIVKQNGAFVDVHSTPGQGAVFDIFFPRVAGEESRPTSLTDRIASGGETVLVIEDDSSVRHAAVRALSSAGYHVLAADGGQQALEIVKREVAPLHLILTDVVMAGQGGREVARRISELPSGRPDALHVRVHARSHQPARRARRGSRLPPQALHARRAPCPGAAVARSEDSGHERLDWQGLELGLIKPSHAPKRFRAPSPRAMTNPLPTSSPPSTSPASWRGSIRDPTARLARSP